MKPASYENAIRLQFDTLMKKVIDCTVKDYHREMTRRAKYEITFSELPALLLESFSTCDTYELDCTTFNVHGIEVRVSETTLCNALQKLTERNRNNVLMYYFLDMSDTEIAAIQGISRAGVYKNRMRALTLMKNLIKED